uniref:TetR/AcrR family transcriptional regulator n=1 Tax=Roseihalotalea indica TaxID=2867963 RepID=A0AA49GK97_9BACT|nr:TetR/AcrR family transcriptional regulator [Tunicatimonas sp. TK19036]
MVTLRLSDRYFTRDPQHTELGSKIISSSIRMIDMLGFEQFTFKKLATEIQSTEASVYRYFENKHKLLIYLIAWYWKWMEYLIDYRTNNIDDPVQRLQIALKALCDEVAFDPTFANIDETALYRIVISESNKTYLTKQVDKDNKGGLFRGYKDLCKRIAAIVKEINADYPYAHALISTALEASHQQAFFAQHLPSLTELEGEGSVLHEQIYQYVKAMVFSTIKCPNTK